jgi:hypothetical protein
MQTLSAVFEFLHADRMTDRAKLVGAYMQLSVTKVPENNITIKTRRVLINTALHVDF